jgi:hypothetical protein
MRYDHFGSLARGEQKFLTNHFREVIPNDACLCRGHRKEARRHICDPEYVQGDSHHDEQHLSSKDLDGEDDEDDYDDENDYDDADGEAIAYDENYDTDSFQS